MAAMEEVEVVVAHNERATVRVGDVFVKIDGDRERLDLEVRAMELAPVPTPEILWCRPPVLALGAVPGRALGRLEEPSAASAAAWSAAGTAIRRLHDAPLPPWPGDRVEDLAAQLDVECVWLVDHEVLSPNVVAANRARAERVLRPWAPVFIHGDFQIAHVFVEGDEVTGIIDWSDAGPGDALFDLAVLTLAHEERLDDVLAGYGGDVDQELIAAWWSMRCLLAVRWLAEHGFGPIEAMPEVAVLRRSG